MHVILSTHTVFFLETNTAAIISTHLLHIINQRPTGKKLTAAACSGDGTLPTLQQEHTFSHPMHLEVILPLAIFVLVLQKRISGDSSIHQKHVECDCVKDADLSFAKFISFLHLVCVAIGPVVLFAWRINTRLPIKFWSPQQWGPGEHQLLSRAWGSARPRLNARSFTWPCGVSRYYVRSIGEDFDIILTIPTYTVSQ